MTLKQLHIAVLLSLLGLASCKDRMAVEENDGKSPIRLAVGGVDAPDTELTRAVITDGTGKTLRAFTGTTRLFFAMVAEHATDGGKPKLYGFNYGTAAAVASPAENSKSDVTYSNNYLYWDDAYARDTKVSVYSIAVANKERGNVILGRTSGTTITIGTEGGAKAMIPFANPMPVDPVFSWQLGESDGGSAYRQTKNIFEWADLVFSNNIADYSSVSKPDKRLKFHTESGSMYHKFDKGDLIYYHALTQLTIHIKCGDGFKADGTDFQFTNKIGTADNSFALNGFYGASGVFEIVNGEFQAMSSTNLRNWTSIYKAQEIRQKAASGDYYVMRAYVFPGTDMSTGDIDNMFSFVIDRNRYDISMASLYAALEANNTIADVLTDSKYLKAGYNYDFTFTVGKSSIDVISAQVADWEVVTAQEKPVKPEAIEVSTATIGDHYQYANPFDLYRLPYIYPETDINLEIKNYDWVGRYTDKATLTGPSTSNTWRTNWFFESNKHFYHFRAVSPKAASQGETTVQTGTSPADDYLNLVTGKYSSTPASSYTDVLWGAPFTGPTGAGSKYGYDPSTKGFDGTTGNHQIHHGIVTTTSTINLLLFHMMSEVTFNITTTTGADKVLLQSGDGSVNTKVELIEYYANGKVLMGNGLVQTTGSKSTENAGYPLTLDSYTAEDGETPAKSIFHYGVVPQSLANVKLRITTPDNNQYTVNLAGAKASAISTSNLANPYSQVGGTGDDASKYKIDSWYPGFKYTYTFTLKKSGIIDITATIVNWENISADNEDVTIK